MCYDLAFSSDIEQLSEYLPSLIKPGNLDIHFEPTYHKIAQGYPNWPIIIQEEGQLKLQQFQWGIIAPYMNTPEKIKKSRKWMVNARSEKILDKKAYWNRIRKNHCLGSSYRIF